MAGADHERLEGGHLMYRSVVLHHTARKVLILQATTTSISVRFAPQDMPGPS